MGNRSRRRYPLVIPSLDRNEVLVNVWPDRSIELPVVDILFDENWTWEYYFQEFEEFLRTTFGTAIHVVRRLLDIKGESSESAALAQFHEFEILLAEFTEEYRVLDENLRWVSRKWAETCNWTENEKRFGFRYQEIVSQAFKEINGDLCLRLAPWHCLGWWGNVEQWVSECLKTKGLTIQDGLRLRHYQHQSILWVCTAYEDSEQNVGNSKGYEVLYVKASLPLFREAEKTMAIAEVLGNMVPEILAVHPTDGIMIQRDVGRLEDDSVHMETIIDEIARMHSISNTDLDKLRSAGVQDLGSEWFAEKVEWMLHHPVLDMMAKDEEFLKEDIEELRKECATLRKACVKLSSYEVRSTLVHGDLHCDNVGRRSEARSRVYRFLDWEHAMISNPFIDFHIGGGMSDLLDSAEERQRAMKMYEEYWSGLSSQLHFESIDLLSRMLKHGTWMYKLLYQHDHYDSRQWKVCRALMGEVLGFFMETALQVIDEVSPRISS